MSYTHLLYHIVFATKDRMPLITEPWEGELYKYLAGIIKNHGGEAIEINGMSEHVHVLTRLKPLPALPDFMRELKAGSSKWAKRHQPKFSWQRPYGAFVFHTLGQRRTPWLQLTPTASPVVRVMVACFAGLDGLNFSLALLLFKLLHYDSRQKVEVLI